MRDVQEEGGGEQEAWDVDTVSITLKMCAVAHPARVVLVCVAKATVVDLGSGSLARHPANLERNSL